MNNIEKVLKHYSDRLEQDKQSLEFTKDFKGEFILGNNLKIAEIEQGAILVQALEKQIAKQCSCDVNYITAYCPSCGQKLDWSIDNE